jgi:hypothetical protein
MVLSNISNPTGAPGVIFSDFLPTRKAIQTVAAGAAAVALYNIAALAVRPAGILIADIATTMATTIVRKLATRDVWT